MSGQTKLDDRMRQLDPWVLHANRQAHGASNGIDEAVSGQDSILLPLGAHSQDHIADFHGAKLETKPSKNWMSPPLQERATMGRALPFVGLSIAIITSIFYIFPA
jgi:hypothetical protein